MRSPRAKCLCLLSLFLASCGPATPSAHKAAVGPTRGEAPRTEDEKRVAALVMEDADDPGSVEFSAWDTYDPNRDESLSGPAKYAVKWRGVRVRYRANNRQGARQLYDRTYLVKDGRAQDGRDNKFEDDWVRLEWRWTAAAERNPEWLARQGTARDTGPWGKAFAKPGSD